MTQMSTRFRQTPESHESRGLRARLGLLGAGLGAAALVLASAAAGSAATAAPATRASITHTETTDSGISVLVSVPAAATVDLTKVSVTINDQKTTAKAVQATGSSTVKRTAVLAIDTSESMKGPKFTAAKAAALQFITSVPSDVNVGVIGFAKDVTTYLQPSTDRAAAQKVVAGLQLSLGTALYQGASTAANLAGGQGQTTVLVLSDGADTTPTSLPGTVTSIHKSGAVVDVVALGGSSGTAAAALSTLAKAGKGQVISADPSALRHTFSAEAAVLAHQVLVTAAVPQGVTSDNATVAVTLPTTAGALTASAFVIVRGAAPVTTPTAPSDSGGGLQVPHWTMYAGVVALGIGLIVLLMLLVPSDPAPLTAAETVTNYTKISARSGANDKADVDQLASAKDAAADLLRRNQTLEARIQHRLEGAGSELKPAEWLLVHGGIVFVAALVGFALGKGNIFIGLMFLVAGAVGPWFFLGFQRSRRRKAFNQGLPDTLQLMSGSLTAGLSLAQSVDTIVREGSEPISSEFRRVLVETRLGVSLEDALEGIAERFESRDFEWVVMAIKIQRQVGGNLAELLDTVAATMREREYVRRQVAALAAEGKLSALVLGLLPPLFMLYLLLANHSYVIVMFQKPLGWLMLGGAATILSVGVFWMSRLVKVEV